MLHWKYEFKLIETFTGRVLKLDKTTNYYWKCVKKENIRRKNWLRKGVFVSIILSNDMLIPGRNQS